jgi:hypothetical protein
VKCPPFRYHYPESIQETTAMLAELGDDAKVLPGGQSLVLLAMWPTHVEDLAHEHVTGPPQHLGPCRQAYHRDQACHDPIIKDTFISFKLPCLSTGFDLQAAGTVPVV